MKLKVIEYRCGPCICLAGTGFISSGELDNLKPTIAPLHNAYDTTLFQMCSLHKNYT